MADTITLKSDQEFLGDLIRSILVDTDLNDLNAGSDIGTMLEAISKSLAAVNTNALKIIENNNIDSLENIRLQQQAESLKLPNGQGGYGAKPANQAVGSVTIGSSFKKISSQLYAGKPAPFQGSTVLYLKDASSFPSTGSLYLARGTVNRFEGPIPYSSITNNGSFWTVSLTSPLTKSHLQSDLVVLSQGGERKVQAGTVCQVQANSETQAIQFKTVNDIVLPDGEAEGTVTVVCTQFGEVGNVLAGSITSFTSIPFSGATVTNPSKFQSGRSSESDEDLRQRIKDYPSTLSRGVKSAIRAAIIGATDPATGRTILSANVLEPVEQGEPARVFIDDGTGLEPTIDGKPYELLLASASGQETRFRLSEFPLTPATIVGSGSAPFVLNNTLDLTVNVDEITETYTITPSNYVNLLSVTAYEVVRDMNSQSNTMGFRTYNNGQNILMMDLSGEAENVSVNEGEWQSILGFTTSEIRPLFLYINSKLQSFRGHTAALTTNQRSDWSLIPSDLQNVRIVVDGVTQTISIIDADFAEFGTNITTATINQYATVFSRKIAGAKQLTSAQNLIMSTWQTFSELGSIEILETKADGTPAGWIGVSKIWKPIASGGKLSDVGSTKDYSFNRFTGEINLLSKPASGDKIEVGSRSTRAFIPSNKTSTGLYTLSPIPTTFGNAKIILGFDGDFAIRSVSVPPSSTSSVSLPPNTRNMIRLTSNNTSLLLNALVSDYIYIAKDNSVVPSWGSTITGIYRIKNKGNNFAAVDQNYLGLPIATSVNTNLTATTSKSSTTVLITNTNHGLKTGDLIKVTTAGAIGGITAGNLSVSNVSIIVLDNNRYTFQALAAATSDATGTLDTVGYNTIIVTHTSHGFSSNALITIVAASNLGGILAASLSQASTPIEVIDSNTYKYRASTASTSAASGTLTSLTYIADTWIEFEISRREESDWSSITTFPVTSGMFNIFYSTVIPEILDFGNSISSVTVDYIVNAFNAQIASGWADKLSPQQFTIRSNDYKSGSSAVLAVIGNASNITSPTITTSIQAHVGYSNSSYTQGSSPVVTDIITPTSPINGYATRTYLKVDKDLTEILDDATNPSIQSASNVTDYPEGFQVVFLTGKEAGLTGRVYNNQVTAPFPGVMRGEDVVRPLGGSDTSQTNPPTLDRYSDFAIRTRDLPLNNYDKLVVEMDLDPTDKTVSVPMYKLAQVQDMDPIVGAGKGQVISFRLNDPEDSNKPFFDNSSVYKNFAFEDFKLLTKSVGLYREDVSDRALILRSVDFLSPSRMKLSIRFPTEPNFPNFFITHTNSFNNNETNMNVIVTLPSQSLISGSLINSGLYAVSSTSSGSLFDWRISHPTINSLNEYVTGNVLNIGGVSDISGSYYINSSNYNVISGASAAVTNGSPLVTVTSSGHGLITNDIVGVTTSTPIGGISSTNLSVAYAQVTVINANSFSYVANTSATSTASGFLDTITSGIVSIKSPMNTTNALFDAAANPISSFALVNANFQGLATALNAYYPDAPIVTGQAIGTGYGTAPITKPTYMVYPQATPYSGSDLSGAYNYHSYASYRSGSAGIWLYDSSSPGTNNIKATVQSDDPIFPTTTDASGTSYSPIGEQVHLVPTNNKTLNDWMNFNATSSLQLLAKVERTDSDSSIQISSIEDGSFGAVSVTGVSANAIISSVVGNAVSDNEASKVQILTADARSVIPNSLINLTNSLSSEILRSYRLLPSGSSITTANTTNINTYFRPTNSIKYVRLDLNTARILFLRNGQGTAQTEPLSSGNTIALTNLGNGLVQVTSALASGTGGTGILSARTGDMMYIQPSSPFAVDARCKAVQGTGQTDGTNPEYLGYPVVHVIDTNNIVVIAPNITTFATTVLTSSTDLLFLPAVWNEKNIRTNHREGSKFDDVVNNNKMYYLIKSIGNNLLSVFIQNSSAEATDTALLNTLSVNTDDLAVFGTGFDVANQGSFKIVAHNGRNHLIIHNPNGGKDEIIDGDGDDIWRVGPITDGTNRALRIISSESVKIGDSLRISTPTNSSQWFNGSLVGTWPIIRIGMSAFNFTGSLPHSYTNGSYDQTKLCPFVDITVPNAPINILDTTNTAVDKFLIGTNDTAIGFTEGTPFNGFRMVEGYSVNPSNPELSDVFLVPKLNSSKITDTFGTSLKVVGKIGYQEQAFQGIDGYKFHTGPVREAHRIIDGLPINTNLYPGVKAAGSFIDVNTPLIKSIMVNLSVKPKDGVSLNSITDLVKSAVASYVNGLDVGDAVVLAEIVRVVQGLPGVYSVTIISTTPTADVDRVTVGESERAFVLDQTTAITVG